MPGPEVTKFLARSELRLLDLIGLLELKVPLLPPIPKVYHHQVNDIEKPNKSFM